MDSKYAKHQQISKKMLKQTTVDLYKNKLASYPYDVINYSNIIKYIEDKSHTNKKQILLILTLLPIAIYLTYGIIHT